MTAAPFIVPGDSKGGMANKGGGWFREELIELEKNLVEGRKRKIKK